MLQPRLLIRESLQWQVQCLSAVYRSYATTTSKSSSSSSSSSTTATPTFTHKTPDVEDGGIKMRTYKPRTPGLRHLIRPINDHLWKGRAYLPLTYPRKGHGIGGRNRTGRVTLRHRGGGHKRRIRIVDFTRMEPGKHIVERIEHDPGRGAHIALLSNTVTKTKSYILACEGMRAEDVVESYRTGVPDELIKSLGGVKDAAMIAAKTAWRGNCLPLHMIPLGTMVYNVGLRPRKGGQLCRGAGTYATVLGGSELTNPKWKGYVSVKLQSGEVRRIHKDACATIGVASNGNYNRRQLGKAGRSRWLGIRPTVRGVAMNASDHPHGGGRGKSKGNVHPISIWGRTPAKGGFKTRKKSNINKLVITPRERNHGRRRRDVGSRR